MKIKVTSKDIMRGKTNSCRECPIALAVKRGLGVKNVSVDGDSIRVADKDYKRIDYYKITKKLWNFINNFDIGLYVEPFNFRLIKE